MKKTINILIISLLILTACSQSFEEKKEETVIKKVTINLCKNDVETAYWSTTKINLFETPRFLRKSSDLPPCASIIVDVLEERTVKDTDLYKVRYGNIIGWQTKRLIEGEV